MLYSILGLHDPSIWIITIKMKIVATNPFRVMISPPSAIRLGRLQKRLIFALQANVE